MRDLVTCVRLRRPADGVARMLHFCTRATVATALFIASWNLVAAPAMAQQPVLKLGDAVVTGFSGVKPPKTPARGKPEDSLFIDPDGNSLVVFDLQNMKGPE